MNSFVAAFSYRSRIATVTLALVLAWASTVLAASPDLVRSIMTQLMCTCGCNMVSASCECSTADGIKADVIKKLDQGWTQQQILDEYVRQYGTKELSAPVKKGFHLTAWVTPFAAVFAGAGIIGVAVRRWVVRYRRGGTVRRSASIDRREIAEYEDLLEKERRRYL